MRDGLRSTKGQLALNDPDDQLRQWAQEQLQKLEASP
jgi:hypothetical protein